LFGGGEISFPFGEGEVSRARGLRRRYAGDNHAAVTDEFTANLFGDLRSG
jgi:hypothetical protein